jgi:hypothetical protein
MILREAAKKVAAGKFPRMAESLVLCIASNSKFISFQGRNSERNGICNNQRGREHHQRQSKYLVKTFMS